MVGCGTAARPSQLPSPGSNDLKTSDREAVRLTSPAGSKARESIRESRLGCRAPALKDATLDREVETVLMTGITTNANADAAISATTSRRASCDCR
jgi:hypothetical protein